MYLPKVKEVHTMLIEVRVNVTGKERKTLVTAIAEALGTSKQPLLHLS